MFSPERAHPVMIFTGFFKQLKGFLIPMVFTLGIQATTGEGFIGNVSGLLIALLFMILSLLGGFLKWFFFRYDYDGDVLHIRSGIFVKKERFIKKERVQTVNYKANVVYRILELVTLQIETAGGYKEPEIDIEAIDKRKASMLRDALSQESEQSEQSPEDEHTKKPSENAKTHKVSYPGLIVAAVTSGGVGAIFIFFIAFVFQLNYFLPEEITERIFGVFQNVGFQILGVILLIIFLVSWIISIISFVVSNGEFIINKKGKSILIQRGLLERKELSIKEHRIQGIRIMENPVRQLLGYAAIELDVAGGSSKEDGFKTTINPLIKKSEIEEFVKFILPDMKYSENINSLPKRALRRYIFRSLILLLPLPFIFYYIPVGIVWLGMILFPLSAFFGYLRYRDAGYCIEGDNILLRYRFFSRTTVLLVHKKIQALESNKNIIQRIRDLTTITATVISVRQSSSFSVKDLDIEQGNEIDKWYLDNCK